MPRANSLDDEGRSLTPDFDDYNELREHEEPGLPMPSTARQRPAVAPIQTSVVSSTSLRSLRHRPEVHPPGHRSHQSTLSPIQPSSVPRHETAREHFRSAVRKVMAMRRASHLLSSGGVVGAEPGVDPRRSSAFEFYGHIRQKCLIDIIDYSPLRTSFGRMTNGEFLRLLGDARASEREPWVRVRWISVGGISWDVVSRLAIKYDMHPLAVEDLLHQRGPHSRSKADYYPKHLFLRILCHTLGSTPATDGFVSSDVTPSSSGWSSTAGTITNLTRSMSPGPLDNKIGIADEDRDRDEDRDFELTDTQDAQYPDVEGGNGPRSHATKLTLEELKRGDRVDVRLEPMCIFLYRDGTVISFHPDPTLEFTRPIVERIRQRDTTLRRTADPSLLVQSLLDLIVDSVLEVVDEYHTKINQLERATLIKPQVKTVRALHILSGDLILHKRTLGPIKSLVYGLRRYDADRCAALIEGGSARSTIGYISPKSNIYLADVHDHMEYALASLDMYAAMAENLISYTFNMASYEMNEVMRRLTTATIIFFPLTLLTGYFGMNFHTMWSLTNSDLFFWELAIPIMAVVVPLFMWSDIKRMALYVKKRMLARRIVKQNVRACCRPHVFPPDRSPLADDPAPTCQARLKASAPAASYGLSRLYIPSYPGYCTFCPHRALTCD
ncbi:hypothetical protein K488DRAFT_59781 [Vararia minispora EC-137]|uniref:Uncharacterized protein n=1 Tax=Vararia minispora EC-137 TaxID=1314806 RepID=A0ACB8Q8G9_9AGAM|nr:hypothetical protein K488DRAFT_59781 [Vararia minispora EC-137]